MAVRIVQELEAALLHHKQTVPAIVVVIQNADGSMIPGGLLAEGPQGVVHEPHGDSMPLGLFQPGPCGMGGARLSVFAFLESHRIAGRTWAFREDLLVFCQLLLRLRRAAKLLIKAV